MASRVGAANSASPKPVRRIPAKGASQSARAAASNGVEQAQDLDKMARELEQERKERRKQLLQEKKTSAQQLVQAKHGFGTQQGKANQASKKLGKAVAELDRLRSRKIKEQERLEAAIAQLVQDKQRLEQEFDLKIAEVEESRGALVEEENLSNMELEQRRAEVEEAEMLCHEVDHALQLLNEEAPESPGRTGRASNRGSSGVSSASQPRTVAQAKRPVRPQSARPAVQEHNMSGAASMPSLPTAGVDEVPAVNSPVAHHGVTKIVTNVTATPQHVQSLPVAKPVPKVPAVAQTTTTETPQAAIQGAIPAAALAMTSAAPSAAPVVTNAQRMPIEPIATATTTTAAPTGPAMVRPLSYPALPHAADAGGVKVLAPSAGGMTPIQFIGQNGTPMVYYHPGQLAPGVVLRPQPAVVATAAQTLPSTFPAKESF